MPPIHQSTTQATKKRKAEPTKVSTIDGTMILVESTTEEHNNTKNMDEPEPV